MLPKILALLILSMPTSGPALYPVPEELQEAVFADAIKRRSDDYVAGLAVHISNASAGVISRLNLGDRKVVAATECTASRRGSYHTASGKVAMIFTIESILYPDASHAVIELTSFRHGLDAEGVTYHLERKANSWSVVSAHSDWVS